MSQKHYTLPSNINAGHNCPECGSKVEYHSGSPLGTLQCSNNTCRISRHVEGRERDKCEGIDPYERHEIDIRSRWPSRT